MLEISSELFILNFDCENLARGGVMQCKHPQRARVLYKGNAAVERIKKHFSSVSQQAKSENANEHFGIIVANSGSSRAQPGLQGR
jgi:hypothetical protein